MSNTYIAICSSNILISFFPRGNVSIVMLVSKTVKGQEIQKNKKIQRIYSSEFDVILQFSLTTLFYKEPNKLEIFQL